jgi:ribonuclease P protein component
VLVFRARYEKNLSTSRKKEIKGAWVSRENEHYGRTAHSQEADVQGPAQSHSEALEEMSFVASLSFPKELKIRTNSEYEEILGKSKRLSTEHFNILCAPNSLGYPRLGLVVAKKSVPGSVERNRIKRVLREFFRLNRTLFGSTDVVFVAKKGSEKLDYSLAKKEIEGIVRSKLS